MVAFFTVGGPSHITLQYDADNDHNPSDSQWIRLASPATSIVIMNCVTNDSLKAALLKITIEDLLVIRPKCPQDLPIQFLTNHSSWISTFMFTYVSIECPMWTVCSGVGNARLSTIHRGTHPAPSTTCPSSTNTPRRRAYRTVLITVISTIVTSIVYHTLRHIERILIYDQLFLCMILPAHWKWDLKILLHSNGVIHQHQMVHIKAATQTVGTQKLKLACDILLKTIKNYVQYLYLFIHIIL